MDVADLTLSDAIDAWEVDESDLDALALAFPPPPSPAEQSCWPRAMPHAPSPSLHLEPLQTASAAKKSTGSGKKKMAPDAMGANAAGMQQLSAAKQLLTLDDVEREILRHNAHLPPEAKRKMAKAELRRLKHCETVRQSRVRKKVSAAGR